MEPNNPAQGSNRTADQGISDKAAEQPDIAGNENAADKPVTEPEGGYRKSNQSNVLDSSSHSCTQRNRNMLEKSGMVLITQKFEGKRYVCL